jgi:hypothetical protein
MTLTVDLPPELESRISSEAARRGVPVSACVLQLLEAATAPEFRPVRGAERDGSPAPSAEAEAPPRPLLTGAQIVQKWRQRGLIGTRPDIEDSVAFVQEMRRKAVTRDWS